MKKVCLDPGHGGTNRSNGAPDKSYYEYIFALDMAKRVKPLLEAAGVDVMLTREDADTSVGLTERADLANAWGADCYVSLHSNAAPSTSCDSEGWCATATGMVVYTYGEGADKPRNILANALIERFRALGHPMRATPLCHAKFTVLAKTAMPACLIEYAFHTCRADVDLLLDGDYRGALAIATAKGICDYLGIAYAAPAPPVVESPTDAQRAAQALIQAGWGGILIDMAEKITGGTK